jgi:hypothetical protein
MWSLIQRCGLRSANNTKKGVDRILKFDYMGSAEFEFGALAESWKQMRSLARADELELKATPFNSRLGKPFWVIAPKSLDEDYLFQGIFGSGHNAFYTKESTHMESWLDVTNKVLHIDTIAWFVLGEQPIFWTCMEDVAKRVFAELSGAPASNPDSAIGVTAETLRMFDNIRFEHAGRTWDAQVRGIYDNHARVRRTDGGEQNVPYSNIWRPNAEVSIAPRS